MSYPTYDYTFQQYANDADRTARPYPERRQHLMRAALGLCGEAGEFADLLKKAMFHGTGHELDVTKATKELGDVLWYVADAAAALGVSLEDVAKMNRDKLRKRYPDGFTPKASVTRVDADEVTP